MTRLERSWRHSVRLGLRLHSGSLQHLLAGRQLLLATHLAISVQSGAWSTGLATAHPMLQMRQTGPSINIPTW